MEVYIFIPRMSTRRACNYMCERVRARGGRGEVLLNKESKI